MRQVMESPKAAIACLEISQGDFGGMVYELASSETFIGRDPKTDITLLDHAVSRQHAVLVFEGRERAHRIEDLDSTNGTRVNGKSVRAAVLADGDEIELGHTRFLYSK